jgi:hypothetical protein
MRDGACVAPLVRARRASGATAPFLRGQQEEGFCFEGSQPQTTCVVGGMQHRTVLNQANTWSVLEFDRSLFFRLVSSPSFSRGQLN